MIKNKLKTDFIVIGSGISGVRAAISASKYGKVLIVTKSKLESGSTKHAQGGVAVALSIKDNTKLHFADTISAGAGVCDPEAVWILVTEGLERIKELIKWGTEFDRQDGKLSFTKEGAHRKRRVIHAHGDATGQELERSLLEKVKSNKKINFKEHFFTVDLIVNDGKCYGIIGIDRNSGEEVLIYSKAVILASGGAGQVFLSTTNPLVSTGDGVAMASRAGAYIADMEFIQFHPTALALNITPRFLISEAVRGEGAILLNHSGKRFMENFPMKELAPRDIVAREIFYEMKREKKDFVYLDLSRISKSRILKRFPTIYKFCKGYNLDITKDLVPVVPSSHYLVGGVKTDYNAQTNIEGLFACGEVANVGIHGANRLASNSLLDGLVFGRRAGEMMNIFKKQKVTEVKNKFNLGKNSNKTFTKDREKLQATMQKYVGIIRGESNLKKSLRTVLKLKKKLSKPYLNIELLELQNLLIVGELIIKGALAREESRGSHFREDFPFTNDLQWKRHILFRKGRRIE